MRYIKQPPNLSPAGLHRRGSTGGSFGGFFVITMTEKQPFVWDLRRFDELFENEPSVVEIENGWLTICGHYPIELTRIPDERALCEWIYHLTQKTWVTGEIINDFVGAVFAEKGWQLYKHI
jgi:hypothetical protein